MYYFGYCTWLNPPELHRYFPEAKVVTKGYHLYALPAAANRVRVAADWTINLVSRPIAAQLGLVDPASARLGREQAGSQAG